MLRLLELTPLQIHTSGYVAPVARSLIAAVANGDDLDATVRLITRGFGFESFMWGICMEPQPCAAASHYTYMTVSPEWPKRYDRLNYIEIDPRVRGIAANALPIVWDQRTFRESSGEVDAFLDDALSFGIASGITFAVKDARARPAMMALSSAMPFNDEARLQQINSNFGDIMLFGQYFHELIMTGLLDKAIGPLNQGRALSPGERECLGFIARGLASEDISERMSITVRTVQMHVDSMRTKLGASNRQEAVALAIKRGIIVV